MAIIQTIGFTALDQARLRDRIDLATRQVATGNRGTSHGDLGVLARRGIDLRGEVARREAYVGAAEAALAKMDTAQGVLGRLQRIASDLGAEALRARTLGAVDVGVLAQAARAALEEVASLLNTRQGQDYLFAGSDMATAPVPNAAGIATGPMAAAIAADVATLTPANAATVLAGTAATVSAAATTPFSAQLEGPALAEPRRALQIADGERVAWGVLANQDQSGQVALSWGRELLRGLATLAALTPASAAQGAGYDALLDGVHQGLAGAARGLAQEQGALGAAERRVQATRERHQDLFVALRGQVAAVEQVDIADLGARLSQMRSRLEASYQVTASISQLSLAALLR